MKIFPTKMRGFSPRMTFMRSGAIILLLASLLPTILAAGKKSKWDAESAIRKADYLFLEAERHKSAEQVDAYYDLLDFARRLNPNDKFLNSDFGFYQIVISDKDSAMLEEGYGRMSDYFDHNPKDIYNGLTYARVSGMLGKTQKERSAWARLHSVYPDRSEISLRYAESLMGSPDSADRRAAMAIYDSIETVDGKDVQITNVKIRYYLSERDTARVYQELKELLRRFPKSSQVASYAGDVHSAIGDKDGALGYYMVACQIDSTDGYAFYSLANYYNSIGDKEAYNEAIKNALMRKSLDLETKLRIFTTYIVNRGENTLAGLYDEATDSLSTEYPTPELTSPQGEITRAETSEPHRDSEIENMLNLLVEEYPHEAEVYNFYGSYLLSIPDYEAAEEQFRNSLDINPADEQKWYTLIGLGFQNEHLDKAKSDAKNALKYFPESPRLYLMLTAISQQENKQDEALKYLRQADEVCDSLDFALRSEILGSMGDIKYSQGHKNEAFDLYQQALELYPDNYLASNNAAYFMACENRDLDKALKMIERVVVMQPDNPTYIDTYAWILFKLKRYPEAFTEIEKALELIGEDSYSGEELEHAGDIYFMNGDTTKALEYWKKALKIDKNNELLKRKVKNKTIIFE